jgi:hypothetical protein
MLHQRRLAILVERSGVPDKNGNGRPLQCPLARAHADEEGGVKTTIDGGEWGWVQKWGPDDNDDDDAYDANDVASAARAI